MRTNRTYSNRNAVRLCFLLASLLGLLMFVAQVYYSKGGVVRGAPILLIGKPVNILLLPAAIYLVVSVLALILLITTLKQTNSDIKKRRVKAILMVAFLTGTAAFAGTVINMDSYGIVPSKQDDTNCRVIYSWGNSSMHHRFGRFYTMSNNFHLGVKTPYSWSAKGSGKIHDTAWEVRWESGYGTLHTYSSIGIDPDTDIPARFTCDE
ncbi:Uncharacterised protein [Arcanobacterium haemolyticum]|uniref:Uncharacterized protein n=2 Tax=Arcanobacterium haemolyticum TaxID=28264 RepID=D7BMV9_ARCHD|nr:hypothetical protein Arch_0515 [Arcanobacterium haemolyticum DSM 20595]SQH29023.1 Uncharacterised protein [Arcanobacterium haemolyticum]